MRTVASMDWRQGKLNCEFQVNEVVRDVRWLHTNQVSLFRRMVYHRFPQEPEFHGLRGYVKRAVDRSVKSRLSSNDANVHSFSIWQ